MKPFLKKINTRGRKREARRWLKEHDRRRAAIRPIATALSVALREFEELKERDPVLEAAVTELIWSEVWAYLALSDEERRAKEQRRREKLNRTWRRERRIRAQRAAGAKASLLADQV